MVRRILGKRAKNSICYEKKRKKIKTRLDTRLKKVLSSRPNSSKKKKVTKSITDQRAAAKTSLVTYQSYHEVNVYICMYQCTNVYVLNYE